MQIFLPAVFHTRTLLSILADFKGVLVWTVSAHTLSLPVPSLWGLFRAYHILLVSLSPSCYMAFFFLVLWLGLSTYLPFFAFFDFLFVVHQDGKVSYSVGSLFLLTITKSSILAGDKWFVCISQFQRIYVSHSSARILGCEYKIW